MTDGEDWEVRSTKTIDPTDANTVFLVDHCWTFHADQAKKALKVIPGLANRIASILGVGFPDQEDEDEDEDVSGALDSLVEQLGEKLWDMAETYTIQKDDDKLTVCYMMDELGCRIGHSEQPNVKFAPFFHITKQFAITLMWPVGVEIPTGSVIYRDVTFGESNPHKRAARLAIQGDVDMELLRMDEQEKLDPYRMYGRKEQTLPEEVPADEDHPVTARLLTVTPSSPLKVYTDMDFMGEVVTDEKFKIVNTEEDADFIFTSHHFDQFAQFHDNHPTKIVNQFPNENVLCCKDLLIKVGRRATIDPEIRYMSDEIILKKLNSDQEGWAAEIHPWWMPVGFDLVNELPVFVRHYLERQEAGQDNIWIIKPWNMARGKYIYVTSNLSMIVKLAYTSPKIIQKYIEHPVLFYRGDVGRVKFDIRYVILLKSVKPLKLYKYNVFWLRFANKAFDLEGLDEYEKHFTVMNYTEGADLKQIHSPEFISMFEQQYPNQNWEDLDKKNCAMLRECFESAGSLPPPQGLQHSAQSRSIYAVDFMLQWNEDETEMIPQILEINFNPDNRRACKYHPEFYNHCLNALLFDDVEDIPVTEIC